MAKDDTRKCAHPACTCEVAEDEEYCSAECEEMESTPDMACGCPHAECKGHGESARGARA